MNNDAVILFDGVCNLCNHVVQFVIKRDKKGYFKFASLQSNYAQKRLKETKLHKRDMRSLILIENGTLYRQSTAALKIAQHLSGGWPALSIFLALPRFLRDPVYNFVAKHRYKWFGKRNECMVPSEDLRERFIEKPNE